MKFSRNMVLAVVGLTGGAIIILARQNNVNSVDEQLRIAQEQAESRFKPSENTSPLSNTKSTLSTLVAQYKQIQNSHRTLEEDLNNLRGELAIIRRANNTPQSVVPDALKDVLTEFSSQINKLQSDLELTQSMINQQSSPQVTTKNTVEEITGNSVLPIGADLNSNSLLELIHQPNTVPIETHTPVSPSNSKPKMVVVNQIDVTYKANDTGQSIKSYPIDVSDAENILGSDPLNQNFNTHSDAPNFPHSSQDQPKAIPIYTIPSSSTLFNSVAMSAIIGRVPINNTVSNPFRFKVLVGNDNLASNGLYIPNLQDMVLSGFAEGDFTLECARGTVDTATFTFIDGTVRTIKKENIGWISNEAGIPCIAGQYITNFPDYVAKQGGLTALSGFASAMAQSAVTTTTSNGETTSVVNDAAKKALGDGIQSGTDEIVNWHSERQESAFDAVYVAPGHRIVVNIEEALEIDYELDGRKIVHERNEQEYLGW